MASRVDRCQAETSVWAVPSVWPCEEASPQDLVCTRCPVQKWEQVVLLKGEQCESCSVEAELAACALRLPEQVR